MSHLRSNPHHLKHYSTTFLRFYRNMKSAEGRQRRFLLIVKRILTARANFTGLTVLTVIENRYYKAKYKRISRINTWRLWCICRESRSIKSRNSDARIDRIQPQAEPASVVQVPVKYRRARLFGRRKANP